MRTIALRFGETFSPECGTIRAHQEVIDRIGHVWYGKMGSTVSDRVIEEIFKNSHPRILLTQSGGIGRFWAYVSEISKNTPPLTEIPEYYREIASKFHTWFKVTNLEPAPKEIMSKCIIASSGTPLGLASRHSMSPYFIIDYNEE